MSARSQQSRCCGSARGAYEKKFTFTFKRNHKIEKSGIQELYTVPDLPRSYIGFPVLATLARLHIPCDEGLV